MINPIKHKHYPTVMYLLMILVLTSIIFNLADIFEKIEKSPNYSGKTEIEKDSGSRNTITAYSISLSAGEAGSQTQDKLPFYSYLNFMLIVLTLSAVIFVIGARIIFPRIRHLT